MLGRQGLCGHDLLPLVALFISDFIIDETSR
jgi:hypothetical protein